MVLMTALMKGTRMVHLMVLMKGKSMAFLRELMMALMKGKRKRKVC